MFGRLRRLFRRRAELPRAAVLCDDLGEVARFSGGRPDQILTAILRLARDQRDRGLVDRVVLPLPAHEAVQRLGVMYGRRTIGSILREAFPFSVFESADGCRLILPARTRAQAVAAKKTAKKRSVELLKSWLSPAQLSDYERMGRFTAYGSHSKEPYVINKPAPFNVTMPTGHCICFLPDGNLPDGDVMLAQKIDIETDEPGVLTVANLDGAAGAGGAGGASCVRLRGRRANFIWIDEINP